MKTIYEDLSEERKRLQEEGLLPEWFTTAGWQLFSSKYATKTEKDFKSVARRISKCAAKWTDDPDSWEEKFYNVIWNGWLSCATPILANMGTDRGCNVSCSGNFVNDSVYDFYDTQKEVAMLSKNGFGTSSYLGSIRPRGTEIASGGKASGVLPVLKDFVQLSRDISQGNTRRGAWAGYIEIDHEDFWEIINFLNTSPDDCNIGWVITDKFIKRLNSGDKKAISRYQKVMKTKMVTGKGYFFFIESLGIIVSGRTAGNSCAGTCAGAAGCPAGPGAWRPPPPGRRSWPLRFFRESWRPRPGPRRRGLPPGRPAPGQTRRCPIPGLSPGRRVCGPAPVREAPQSGRNRPPADGGAASSGTRPGHRAS